MQENSETNFAKQHPPTMSDSPFAGKWKLHSSEKYEEYMKALGAPWFVVKMVSSMRPKLEVKVDNDHYWFKMVFPVQSKTDEFTIDEEFEDKTIDGRKSKGIVRQEGKCKLVECTREGDIDVKTTREVNGDELTVTWEIGDVVAVRTFRRE